MEKILLIEDERTIRASVVEILKYYDYEVMSAPNGKEGLDLAKEANPDLIICDVMMPEMDGFQVLEELKKDPSFDTPFIFLTAKVQSDDIRKGMNMGADDYVFKPFKSADLINSVKLRLDKKKQAKDRLQKKTDDLENLVKLMIGHEFSTPMNGIVTMSKFINQNAGKFNDAELDEFCKYLDVSSERLQDTFGKIRKLYEVQEMEKNIIRQKDICNTADLLVDLAKTIAIKNKRPEDLVLGKIEDTVLPVKGNLLFSALYEIIENAFKFSEPGTLVAITAFMVNGFYRISVSDNGTLITADKLSSYKSFQQFDRWKYEQQGLGAGLALAKSIADYYKGQLSFTDNLPNGITVGLTFKI